MQWCDGGTESLVLKFLLTIGFREGASGTSVEANACWEGMKLEADGRAKSRFNAATCFTTKVKGC